MASKNANEIVATQKRISAFNCPSCGSINEILTIFKSGKGVLECADCHVNKVEYLENEIPILQGDTFQVRKPCPECGSKKRYGTIENDKEVIRCAECDSVV